MPQRGRAALQVHNLTDSLAFYVDGLGATLLNEPSGDMALIFYDNTPILLAGPQVEEVRNHLDEPRIVFKPGDALDFDEDNLDTKIQFLHEHGFTDLHEEELPNGSRKVQLEDPSGYKISFTMQPKRSPEETIALYAKGPDMLDKALEGLSAAELDLRRAPDEWSIRQIVHHLADSEMFVLPSLKVSLSHSGNTLIRPPYDLTNWVEVMDYQHRAIEPSLALIRASRQHVKQLLDHIPNSWENYLMSKFSDEEGEGNKVTVGYFINVMGRHIEEHCAEIIATRQIHNL